MNKRVLIYDDDQEILILCKTILAKRNYLVETHTRCENILQDIEHTKPDIILMDLWIPEIGGEKAVTIMKENLETGHIPVLLFSANAEIKEISKKIRADGYIAKPFDINHLLQSIEKYIL